MPEPLARRAVVIGAGMGGIASAKALALLFENVIVLDRDSLPTSPIPRPGAPQDRHTHVLLAGGASALVSLFPDLERDLLGAGAVKVRLQRDMQFETPGFDPFPRRDVGLDMLSQSRPLLEWMCRQALEREPNVEVVGNARVVGIVPSADRGAAAGVECEEAGRTCTLAADLVVDASGRAAPTLAFLAAIGNPRPAESEIGVDLSYATAIFDIPRDRSDDWLMLNHLPARPDVRRGGAMAPMEGGRWAVSLGSAHGDAPPSNLSGFLAYAATFRTPTLYEAIRGAKCQGEIARFNLRSSLRRHFDRMERFPRGLIPVGDSLCRFNPVFGQGMTAAVQQAVALGRLLEQRRAAPDPFEDLAPAFFTEANALLETPWAVAISDFVYPETRGERPPDLEKGFRAQGGLFRLMAADPEVHRLAAEVNHLLKPRSVLRDPALAQRIAALA